MATIQILKKITINSCKCVSPNFNENVCKLVQSLQQFGQFGISSEIKNVSYHKPRNPVPGNLPKWNETAYERIIGTSMLIAVHVTVYMESINMSINGWLDKEWMMDMVR